MRNPKDAELEDDDSGLRVEGNRFEAGKRKPKQPTTLRDAGADTEDILYDRGSCSVRAPQTLNPKP